MSIYTVRRGSQKIRLPINRTGIISSDSVELSMNSLIRRFLLKQICGKLDIIEDLREKHGIMLEKEENSAEYTATCPFCQTPKALTVNKTTGLSYCDACELTEDYFSLKGGYRQSRVEDVLIELCIRLERLAKQDAGRKGGVL